MGFLGKLLSGAGHLKNIVLGVGGLLGGAAVVDTTAGTGITQNILSKVYGVAAKSQKDAGLESGYYSISKLGDLFAKFIESIFGKSEFTESIRNWANKNMGITRDSTSTNGPQDGAPVSTVSNDPAGPTTTASNGIDFTTTGSIKQEYNDISITQNPIGFAKSLATGLGDVMSLEKWADGTNFSSSVNLQKSATLGAVSGAAWLTGQALDIVDTAADYTLGSYYDSTHDFSTSFSQTATNYTVEAMDATIGAPDLSSAWAQTAYFGGSLIPGGAAAKGLGLAGWAGKLVQSFAYSAAGNTAMPAAKMAAPGLTM